jgi:hypothetical protein
MGTNFYRVPKSSDIVIRHQKLYEKVSKLDLWDVSKIKCNFSEPKESGFEFQSVWDEFIEDMNVHLGKRSMGWKFCWNFHKNKHYSNKEELLSFIRSGRVIDEYGDLQDTEEFIEMALTWCEDGFDSHTYYDENPSYRSSWISNEKYHDTYVDGLRISSSVDFS